MLSLLPFLVAYCIKCFDIYFVVGISFTIYIALSSSHTSHNPSLAIIKNGVFSFISNYWIYGMLLAPYHYIKLTIDLNAKSPNALVIANWPPTLPCKIQPPYDLYKNWLFTLFFVAIFHLKLYDLSSLFLPSHFHIRLLLYHQDFLLCIIFYYFEFL